jgi:Flp pilus assembly protein CpaB
MTTTFNPSPPAATNGHKLGGGGQQFGRTLPTREKRPGFVALAIILVVGLAALGGYFYQQAGSKTPVVVVVHDIPVGHMIERSDLSTVDVAGSVTAIAGDHIDSVVGKTAAVELLPNTLLQRSMVSTSSPITAGRVKVGVAVKPGQIPADGLNPGDRVEVLQLPTKDAGGQVGTPQVLTDSAEVFSTAPDPSNSGGTLLSLMVPASAAANVAAASGSGQIALLQVAAK